MELQVIATEVCGPLPHGTVGLLLSFSSFTLEGLQGLLGVTDTNDTGEVNVTVQTI